MLDLRRRQFITLLGGAAAAWPLAARAQQPRKTPTIGLLGATTPAVAGQWIAPFAQRLHELGWTEGRTVAIEYRFADGRNERMAEIVAEFVRARADVIVAQGTQAALTAKNATAGIVGSEEQRLARWVIYAVLAAPIAATLLHDL
jgi:putative tryptophan/tyrosine transport system substrate-binding protein